ncbi:hypothetical protein L2E82_09774 [Cichorium intybus]|uniref:Uncharacterized protein n=1 Tax=Cichorium intybus TaxID=13427 RepID=A0ACB9G991_CICIN|nr:hypothetical protein L2E82_09774 [Cichorium intybus]
MGSSKGVDEVMPSSRYSQVATGQVGTAAAIGADNGPQSQPQGGQGGPKTQEANQVYGQGQGQYGNGRPYRPYNQGQQNFNNQRQNNYQGQSSNPPRQHQPANGNTNGNGSSNNRGPNNSINNAPGTQEDLVPKMYEMFNTTQQQSQANAKAIVNMERQIAQMAEDQRKKDNRKLPSTTEVNPTHGQRAGKEHVNTVDAEWRKVTLEDLLESGNEA